MDSVNADIQRMINAYKNYVAIDYKELEALMTSDELRYCNRQKMLKKLSRNTMSERLMDASMYKLLQIQRDILQEMKARGVKIPYKRVFE